MKKGISLRYAFLVVSFDLDEEADGRNEAAGECREVPQHNKEQGQQKAHQTVLHLFIPYAAKVKHD
jgi:hypothetical protein